MLYMVIERFKEGAAPQIYQRLRDKGRMMPQGLEYVSSWIDLDFKICYQVMRTEDKSLFGQWTDAWARASDIGFRLMHVVEQEPDCNQSAGYAQHPCQDVFHCCLPALTCGRGRAQRLVRNRIIGRGFAAG